MKTKTMFATTVLLLCAAAIPTAQAGPTDQPGPCWGIRSESGGFPGANIVTVSLLISGDAVIKIWTPADPLNPTGSGDWSFVGLCAYVGSPPTACLAVHVAECIQWIVDHIPGAAQPILCLVHPENCITNQPPP